MYYHNPYIEDKQTTQWPKEKVQKDKQRSTKHTDKTICLPLFTEEHLDALQHLTTKYIHE
jgi:hypothetical protein